MTSCSVCQMFMFMSLLNVLHLSYAALYTQTQYVVPDSCVLNQQCCLALQSFEDSPRNTHKTSFLAQRPRFGAGALGADSAPSASASVARATESCNEM